MTSKKDIDYIISYMIENDLTVRQASEYFKKSKSIIHVYCHKCSVMYREEIEKLLFRHFEQKNYNGGQSTKKRWESIR